MLKLIKVLYLVNYNIHTLGTNGLNTLFTVMSGLCVTPVECWTRCTIHDKYYNLLA